MIFQEEPLPPTVKSWPNTVNAAQRVPLSPWPTTLLTLPLLSLPPWISYVLSYCQSLCLFSSLYLLVPRGGVLVVYQYGKSINYCEKNPQMKSTCDTFVIKNRLITAAIYFNSVVFKVVSSHNKVQQLVNSSHQLKSSSFFAFVPSTVIYNQIKK